MCHYITATLPPGADVERVRNIAKQFHLAWKPIELGRVVSKLKSGETYYLTTAGHCDCGTVLGCLSNDRTKPSNDHKREIAKLRRKGWSQTKIDRWLHEKELATAKAERKDAQTARERQAEADDWIAFLGTVFSSGASASLGVLLHWCTGPIAGSNIELAERKIVAVSSLTPDDLLRMEEDCLYEFLNR